MKDQTDTANDFSPLQAQRSWDRQAEDNVTDRMERLGLLAPMGEVDKVLETVVNNLEVTNNLDIEPEIRCRVLMTSTLESFTIGHTIVLSRGLIDVLPDEASLAAILAHELAHVVLGHRIDTQFAFFDRMLFDEKDTFRHFGFARTPEEESAANAKGHRAAEEFAVQRSAGDRAALPRGAPEPREGDSQSDQPAPGRSRSRRVSMASSAAAPQPAALPTRRRQATVIAALPLGGRIKMDPVERRTGNAEIQTRGLGGGAREDALRGHAVHPLPDARTEEQRHSGRRRRA